ncbi:MAG: hypothetical protein ACOZBZ_04325 [Patescibacteria group bacterium]
MKRILSILGHLLALGVILLFWFPIAKSYYQAVPTIGADFLQFPTYVAYIKNHFQLPPASWKYIWYSGFPLVFDMAWLHMYLTLPLTFFLSVVNASRAYLILTMFGQLAFSYLLLYELCRSRFVSLALTLALSSSVNFYHGLWDGGTATFSATRMFLPLTLLWFVKYFKSKNNKFLLLSGLIIGLAILGHPGSLFLIILGPAVLFFLFWQDKETPLLSLKKILGTIVFTLIGFLIGGVTLYPIIEQILTHPGFAQFGLTTKIHEDALTGIYSFSNPFLLFLFFLFSFLVFFRGKIRRVPEATAFLILILYVLGSCVLYLIGHHPLSQALGPGRIWWIFSLALAGAIALFWQALFPSREGKWWAKKNLLSFLSLLLFVPIFASFYLPSFKERLDKITAEHMGYPSNVQLAVINEDRQAIEKAIVPSWLNTQLIDYRYYEISPGVETWWNSVFPLPLVKGYYGIFGVKATDWLYWVDNTLLGEYVWHFGVPEAIAKKHALFLIDWYAIRYFEGGGLALAEYLEQDPGVVETKTEVNIEASEPLKPYKFFDEITSPIIRPTNSPTILMVGDTVAYDTFLKVLATENLNSRYLIPLHGPEYLEDLSSWDLADFDVIFLYSYKYRNEKDFRSRPNRVWEKLEEYVRAGGRLLIETGEEVMESDSSALSSRGQDILPDVFPIERTLRGALGESWDLTVTESPIVEGIEFGKFSQLLYEGSPWKLSYASNSVRPWAKTILSQGGKPILVEGKLGEGKVIWSGINLPYHFLYYLNLEEGELFKNILGEMVSLGREEDIKTARVWRISPEKIEVSGENFSGIVFKEQAYPGWQGNLLEPQNKKLKVYRAGPYFMYFKIPEETKGKIKASLTYKGAPLGWLLFIISMETIIFVFLGFIFEKSLSRFILILSSKVGRRLNTWWGKEEE